MTKITPDLMAILSSKINGISRQMTYVLQKSARSSIISNARDFSTAVCDRHGDVIALPNGFPVHAANMGLTLKETFKIHPPNTLKQGDAILNNSPYHGNTHMGDHTIIVPVFIEDEIVFYTTIRAHQADIGNSIPTTYHGLAKDIYEEGALCFPGVKIQKEFQDVEDIINMCKMRIRVPEVWYGDYSAAVGAARIGEKELSKLVDKYGKDTIKKFCQKWQEYGSKKMENEIKKMPSGTWSGESTHDSIPGIHDNKGIKVKAKVTVNQEHGKVIVDFTENGDPIDCGYNLCEATVLAAGITAVMNCLPNANDLPLCEGTFSRIEVIMKEEGVIGKAKFPYSSAVATTSLFERAVFAAQLALGQANDKFSMSEGSLITVPSQPVISGNDSRYNRPFITQISSGISGGMAVSGHDGYATFSGVCTGGLSVWNPFEVLEQKYPIQFEMQEVIKDSCGAGTWDGGPGTRVVIKMKDDKVNFIITCDNSENPPKGVKGGEDGRPIFAYQADKNNNITDITGTFINVELEPNETFISESSAGGGLGNPFKRDPELVKLRVKKGWLSLKKAKEVYGVIIDAADENYKVDYNKTNELRNRRLVK